jgi:hypothetical protein
MLDIHYLKMKKLIKELQFIESEYEYQSEFLKISDMDFLKSVESILESHPELKDLYYKKQELDLNVVSDDVKLSSEDRLISDDVNEINDDIQKEFSVEGEVEDSIDSHELKKIYRLIVKLTHPDKVSNVKLNNLYLKATEAYENKDIAILYKICFDLDMDIKITEYEMCKISDKIDFYKKNINFLKSTFTFKWVETNSEELKNKIIIEYIKNRII